MVPMKPLWGQNIYDIAIWTLWDFASKDSCTETECRKKLYNLAHTRNIGSTRALPAGFSKPKQVDTSPSRRVSGAQEV